MLADNSDSWRNAVVPDKSNPCWRGLVTGSKKIQTQTLGLQMLLKRYQGSITPSSPAASINAAAEELHGFFVKYEKILGNEIKSL
jgi:hypothetical protein